MSKWGTNQRIAKSVAMGANRNAVGQTFSQELQAQYGEDPEVAAWLEANARKLDQANDDGTIPMADSEINRKEQHFEFKEQMYTDSCNSSS